ncbi:MAG: response regulator [Bacteroidota bacterium]|nr:response regulator [Bacteroidota bacterium]
MNPNFIEVLLVEDNPADAELTLRELKKNKLVNTCYHARDGEEALEFLFATGRFAASRSIASPPKLVLLDLKMPKIGGLEVLEKIKSDERTKATPVVVLTSSREDPDIQKCYQLGANSYIVKPVNFENFAQSIKGIGFYWLLLNQDPTN